MRELFKAVGITSAKKPKRYRELSVSDCNLLLFVSKTCTSSSSSKLGFPSNGKEWNEFCHVHREHARNEQIQFPNLIPGSAFC